MSAPTVPTPPTPQPGLPRTIGVFNVLFGLVLLLCGAGCLYLVVPFILAINPLPDPNLTQGTLEGMRDAMVKDLRSREAAANTDAERQQIRASRAALESRSSDLTGKVDFAKIAHDIPWLARYLWADAISGPVLNLALLVTGIGLMAHKEWARRGAIGVAVLKVVRLFVLNGLLALVVVPRLTDACDQIARTDLGGEVVKHVMDQQNAGKGAGAVKAPQLTPAELIQLLRAFGYGTAFMTLGAGIIYPVVVLVVLTRPEHVPRARACRRDRGKG